MDYVDDHLKKLIIFKGRLIFIAEYKLYRSTLTMFTNAV
jgi:hypothetical protein